MALAPKFNVQKMVWDRSVIKTNWRKINETPLKKAGLLVRNISRRSIRHVKRRTTPANPPGGPPKSRSPRRPFKMIYSVPNMVASSVYVGMVGFHASFNPVPGLHEHGGRAKRKIFSRAGFRQLKKGGRGGAITKRIVATVSYPKRPFMLPALMKSLHKLPMLWRNSLI